MLPVAVNPPTSATLRHRTVTNDGPDGTKRAAVRDSTSPRATSNTYCHTGRLANEILAAIFADVINGRDDGPRYAELYRLMDVCSLWKSIAERAPPLWSVVEGDMSVEFLEIALSRSRNHPLYVLWMFEPLKVSSDAIRFPPIIHHMERWVFLSLGGSPSPELRSLLTSRGAPRLKSLRLGTLLDFAKPSREATAFNIFSGDTPILESMRIISFPVLWDSGMFTGLRELEITKPHPTVPSPTQLQTVLSRTPHLTRLVMRHFLDRSPPLTTRDRITLPDLRFVQLSQVHPQLVHALLQYVEAPHLTSLLILRQSLFVTDVDVSDRHAVRCCWLLTIPYLPIRSKPMVPLHLMIGSEGSLEKVAIESHTIRFEVLQSDDWGDVAPALTLREFVAELERLGVAAIASTGASIEFCGLEHSFDPEGLEPLAYLGTIVFHRVEGSTRFPEYISNMGPALGSCPFPSLQNLSLVIPQGRPDALVLLRTAIQRRYASSLERPARLASLELKQEETYRGTSEETINNEVLVELEGILGSDVVHYVPAMF